MRLNCLTILHVSILVALFLTLDADKSPEDSFWPYVYRGVGLMVFVLIMLTLCVASRCRCKGESSDTPDLSCQPSHDALPPTHIYENDYPEGNEGESRDTPDLSRQPSRDALPPTHIYEND
ncbi:uncharacterized protein LOC114551107 isoform X2 [Perca flavescens]|uniref:uncharacterized protein LOC114551107 isoform X2 n=1 Tax=Perca flavescens TaxID=8167 RepID=UPI00106EC8D9|nr:uncharacterized protein LOC114551107 isoform X2 [Perca flavescens]